MPDAVLVGRLAGGDGGPHHRAQQGRAALQAAVGPVLAQAREVGKLALGQHQVDGGGVHAVQGQDDHAPRARLAGAAGREAEGEAGEEDDLPAHGGRLWCGAIGESSPAEATMK